MIIPKSKYRKEDGRTFVTPAIIREYHTPEEAADFDQWHSGQTYMELEDGSVGIYGHDYTRWMSQGKMTQQRSDDWD